jgi:hypothetical protein
MEEKAKLEIPKRLRANILAQIRREEHRLAKIYFAISCVIMPLACLGVVFSLQYMLQELYSSNFYNFSLLFLSDTDIMLAYWREVALSLMETIPFFGIATALIGIVTLLASVRIFVNNWQGRRTPSFSN